MTEGLALMARWNERERPSSRVRVNTPRLRHVMEM